MRTPYLYAIRENMRRSHDDNDDDDALTVAGGKPHYELTQRHRRRHCIDERFGGVLGRLDGWFVGWFVGFVWKACARVPCSIRPANVRNVCVAHTMALAYKHVRSTRSECSSVSDRILTPMRLVSLKTCWHERIIVWSNCVGCVWRWTWANAIPLCPNRVTIATRSLVPITKRN